MEKITSSEMEIILVRYFNWKRNLIIPRVSWGFGIHECDLLIMTKSRYLYEVEIKISKADLKKDLDKGHNHISNKISRLYFAIPDYLNNCIEYIPERAGILEISESPVKRYGIKLENIDKRGNNYFIVKKIRESKINKEALSIDYEDAYKLGRLGTLRMWNYIFKDRVRKINNNIYKIE